MVKKFFTYFIPISTIHFTWLAFLSHKEISLAFATALYQGILMAFLLLLFGLAIKSIFKFIKKGNS